MRRFKIYRYAVTAVLAGVLALEVPAQALGGGNDRDYQEYWHYFNGNGEAVKGKRVIGGQKVLF